MKCEKCKREIFDIEISKKNYTLEDNKIDVFIFFQNTWHKREGYEEHKCGWERKI